jgi:uncharacterized protein YcfL
VILRAALAVLLAAALVAATAPAVDHARTERAEGRMAANVAATEAAAQSLAADETVPAHREGARRTVAVEVPGRAWDVATVASVRLTSESERTLTLTYRIDGRGERSRTVDAPVPITVDGDDPIELNGRGNHDLVLTLRNGDPRRVVVDRREIE